jgi:prepilin peptidase CpaA
VISGVLGLWAAAVAWTDWRSHKVPNGVLVLLLVPALLVLIVNGKGLLGVALLPSLAGLLIGGGILLPGYALGMMGAGDIKFSASIGLLLGPLATVKMLLVFGIALGALSAGCWLYNRGAPDRGKRRIAAAPALALGFISQLFAEQWSWSFFG